VVWIVRLRLRRTQKRTRCAYPPPGGEFVADINDLLSDADAAWHVRVP
jgi:hypothetical protein